MPNYSIISDTDCSIPVSLAEALCIRQVPIAVQFGDDSYEAVYGIDDHATFERINREGRLPTTAAPSPGEFATAFQAAFDEGSAGIVCFCVSSEVSATYSAALTARDLFPSQDITIVDTLSLTMGQGFQVLAAAEAAAGGAGRNGILAAAADVRARTHLFAALPTLKYLAMSGRVGSIAAGMASLLNIQPILTIRAGKLDLLERTRTRGKAWNRVFELVEETVGGQAITRLSIVHVDAPHAAAEFERQLRARIPCPVDALVAELTPGLSVHAGAGLVGAAFVL